MTLFSRLWERIKGVETSHISGYITETRNQSETMKTSRSWQEQQKWPKTVKKVIFKGHGSLEVFFARLLERLEVFWTSHMSRNLMEQIRDIEDFKGAVMNIKTGKKSQKDPKRQKGLFQRRQQS